MQPSRVSAMPLIRSTKVLAPGSSVTWQRIAATGSSTGPALPVKPASAFNKLFVETEILPEHRAVLCTHRARAPDDPAPWMFHLLAMHEPFGSELTFETDLMRFIGRGHSTADPQALDAGWAASVAAAASTTSV